MRRPDQEMEEFRHRWDDLGENRRMVNAHLDVRDAAEGEGLTLMPPYPRLLASRQRPTKARQLARRIRDYSGPRSNENRDFWGYTSRG